MGASPVELTDAESAARTSPESQVSCRIGGSEPLTLCVVKLACGQGGGCRCKTLKRQGERGLCYGRAGRFWKTDIFLPDGQIRGFLFEGAVAANGQGRLSPQERSIFLVALLARFAPFAGLAAGLRDAAQDRSPGKRKTGRLKMAPQAFEITESAPENGTCCPSVRMTVQKWIRKWV
jgi:hypothetical protein